MQKNVECNASKHALNFENLNPSDCGLGCQLHVISAGIICATEMNKQYLVIKHQGKYDEYFNSFKLACGNRDQQLCILNLHFNYFFWLNLVVCVF